MCGGVLSSRLAEKEKQVSDLQGELAKLRESLELHRNKNNVGVLSCRQCCYCLSLPSTSPVWPCDTSAELILDVLP